MPNYRIIFIDIDGTLQNQEKVITPETKEILSKLEKQGVYVVLCTGRSLGYTLNKARECNIGFYIVSSNGAEVYDIKNKRHIFEKTIDNDVLKKLWQVSQDKNIEFLLNGDDPSQINIMIENDTLIDEAIKNKKIFQCIMLGSEMGSIKEAENLIKQIPSIEIKNRSKCLIDPNFPIPDTFYYDISDVDTSKGMGVKQLCDYLKINLDDAIAIGDSYNDVSMFEVVGLSVAMGNFPEEVKKSADVVTTDVNNNGIVNILNKVFFEK